MLHQNIFIASSLALLAGCCQVLAVLILAYPEFHKGKGNKLNASLEKVLVPLNILFQFIVGALNTISTWFGPVSIVMPMRISSQLLFNMLFFESLGIEEFTKDIRVGTFIVVTAAFNLPLVGPTVQQDQNVVKILEHWPSEVWALLLTVLAVMSGSYSIRFFFIKFRGGGNITHRYKTSILLTAHVACTVLSTSISKFFVVTSGYALLSAVIGFLFCSVILLVVAILQATEVEQNSFVPESACGIQFVNAITGLIIWQDWKVVQAWSGYALNMMQVLLGIYLIASTDEFSNSADFDFSLKQSLAIRTAKDMRNIQRKEGLGGNPTMKNLAGGNLKSILVLGVNPSNETLMKSLHGGYLSSMLLGIDESNESIGEEESRLRVAGEDSREEYSSFSSVPNDDDSLLTFPLGSDEPLPPQKKKVDRSSRVVKFFSKKKNNIDKSVTF